MKVSELIDQLNEADPNSNVCIYHDTEESNPYYQKYRIVKGHKENICVSMMAVMD